MADNDDIDTIETALDEMTKKEEKIADELKKLYRLSKDLSLAERGCWVSW